VQVADSGGGLPIGMIDLPGAQGIQIQNMQDMLSKMFGGRQRPRRMTVGDARQALVHDEADKLLDQEALTREAVANAENNGIVFLDELDKICARGAGGDGPGGGFRGGDVSREGVQRDLLPLIEGTTVTTKHGPVKTDHILFVASGAFHLAKPSDLLPELQGRLPIRVELAALTRDDFRRILTEPEHSLVKQYVALLSTEGMTLEITEDAVDAIADLAAEINARVENIGARRLATVMERLLEEVSFTASDRRGETVRVDAAYVRERVAPLAASADLSRFIL
jgi:ATP-dependent HslUV protease ATP-binding subunit HslU